MKRAGNSKVRNVWMKKINHVDFVNHQKRLQQIKSRNTQFRDF